MLQIFQSVMKITMNFLSRVFSTQTALGMNLYGCFIPEFNHMILFGQLWHAIARSLISREDDS